MCTRAFLEVEGILALGVLPLMLSTAVYTVNLALVLVGGSEIHGHSWLESLRPAWIAEYSSPTNKTK